MPFSEKKLKLGGNPEKEKYRIIIPENEYTINYILSSGPGGQNVNRRKTCAELFFPIYESQILTPIQQRKLIDNYPHPSEISEDGVIRITAQEERSQEQNRKRAIEKLHENVNFALRPQKRRIIREPGWVKKKKSETRRIFKQKRTEKKDRRKPPEILSSR